MATASTPRLASTAFVALVMAAGAAVLGHSLSLLVRIPDPMSWAALSVLAVVAGSFALKVPGVPVYLSVSDAFFMASGLLFGPAAAAVTIGLDSLIVSIRRGNQRRQLAFNVTSCSLALWCGVHAYEALAGPDGLALALTAPESAAIAPLAGLAAVYFLCNSGLTAIAVALSKGESPWRLWRAHFAVMSVNYFAAASAAYVLIILVRHIGLGALALVTPVILVCHLAMRSWLGRQDDARRHLQDVNRLYLSTISAFSTAIEAKDGVTSSHIHRVQAYAMGLARAVGVTDDETLKALEAAALLHDTGKLAIPEHILNKPGKLTAQEFETMKAHVDIGADILATIDFPYPVVPIVRAHHENWNGSGYPRGLQGEAIPIGARILSVVDCFDALTSDRPYRPALSDAAALEIIVQSRGKMYDPLVVDTFARVYRDIAPQTLPAAKLDALLTTIRSGSAGAASATPPPMASPAPASAAATATPVNELLAFVSLSRLAAGSPTIRDIGALAEGHLRHLAPGATVAIYTCDATGSRLSAELAHGPAAAAVAGRAIRIGERLTGWVGANLRSVPSGDARLDLLQETPEGVATVCATPLVAEGTLVGVLTLYGAAPFTDDQSRTLEMVAPHLAAAVAEAVKAVAPPVASPIVARHPSSGLRVVGGAR